jgi:hypothetical protein
MTFIKYFFLSLIVDINDIFTTTGTESTTATLILAAKLGFLIGLIYLARRCYKWIFAEEN